MPIKTSTLKLRVENLENFFAVFLPPKKQRRVFCFDKGLLVDAEESGWKKFFFLFFERKV
jgi:hypothetical protein